MGIEWRRPRSGLDRNKYFKGVFTAGNKLERSETCLGVFYSKDASATSYGTVVSGQIVYAGGRAVLETYDIIDDLEQNDFVLHDGEYYIVERIDKVDDNDSGKVFKSNPTKKTIYLRR